MQSEPLFLKQTEPEVVVKEEPSSSMPASEDHLDKLAPVHVQSNNIPALSPLDNEKCDREPSMASTSADLLNGTEQTKIRLAIKNLKVQAVIDWHRNELSESYPKVKYLPEVGDWAEASESLLSHRLLPRVVLGFMGPSGGGKSSLINALLDEEKLLPRSCEGACTAVAVEIAWNEIEDPNRAYRATMEFITLEEWRADLDLLVAEVLTLEPKGRESSKDAEVKVAAAKIKAVYPDLNLAELTEESASALVDDIVVSQYLGESFEIEMPAGRGTCFAAEIAPYIASGSISRNSRGKLSKATSCWPLVKVVRIFVRSPVLRTGLVLVDLPGSGDANEARAIVAEDYMLQVSAICIVTEISRAADSFIAKDLYGKGEALKRRLLRDGLLDDEHTFFVLTCTDKIDVTDMIEKLSARGLPEMVDILREQTDKTERSESISGECERLEMKLRKSTAASVLPPKKIKTVGDSAGRIIPRSIKENLTDNEKKLHSTRTNSSLPKSKDAAARRARFQENFRKNITELKMEEEGIIAELDAINIRLAAICIRVRNSDVKIQMKEKFSKILQDLAVELKDEGDMEAEGIIRNSQDSIRDGIDTFCVCSAAYQKLCGRHLFSIMPPGFENVEDTSIPQLRKHAIEYTLNASERLGDTTLYESAQLRKRIRDWAENKVPDREITSRQRRLLDERFDHHLKHLEIAASAIIDSVTKSLQARLQGLSNKATKSTVLTATNAARKTFDSWIETLEGMQSFGTWKAICRKRGNHTCLSRGVKTEFNWNAVLTLEFSKLLTVDLRSIAHGQLPKLHQEVTKTIRNAFNFFTAALKTSSLGLAPHISNSLQNLMYNFELLRVEAFIQVGSRFETAVRMSRVIDRKAASAVRLAMKPLYSKGSAISGTGSLRKYKPFFQNHFGKACLPMYETAAENVARGLEDIVTILKSNLALDFKQMIEKMKACFEKMLIIASQTVRPESGAVKLELQKEILEKLDNFESLLDKIQDVKEPVDIGDAEHKEEDEGNANDGPENDYGEDDDEMSEENFSLASDSDSGDQMRRLCETFLEEEMDKS